MERIFRIRDIANDDINDRYWEVLTPQGILRDVNLDTLILNAGKTISSPTISPPAIVRRTIWTISDFSREAVSTVMGALLATVLHGQSGRLKLVPCKR